MDDMGLPDGDAKEIEAPWPYVFSCQIVPLSKGRPRFSNGRVLTDAKTREYERELATLLAESYRGREVLDCPVTVQIEFRLALPVGKRAVSAFWAASKPASDLDNLIKAVTDAANGIVWTDDVRIVALSAKKILTKGKPGITMRVAPA
jgi:Holliday junction resolvase RusA-like endonuclease